jgi:hypothetical protein
VNLSFVEKLDHFQGRVGSLASMAPDEFAEWQSTNYEERKQWVSEFWIVTRARLKRSAEHIPVVDANLTEAFALLDAYQAALDRGETPDLAIRKKGGDLLWEIYNMKSSKFR